MPPTIHRSERICIDISDNVVSIIKLDPEGVMMRAGAAKAPTMPLVPDDAYVTDLSSAIRKAAWSAKVSAGFGASCIVVSGMPDMTMQRFTWPDIPADAIGAIAQEEIMPYLPGASSHFTVGCEVLKQAQGDGNSPDMIEALVAAMPIEHASAIATACKWANFKPKRLELRENARGRLAHYWCAPIEGEVPTTYAILDVGPGMANIAFYQNGMFHSNRYFPPEIVKLDQVDDFEMLMTVKTGGVDDNENAMRYAPEKLTEDIVSAVGHFHRMAAGAKISCILLMDEENIPGIEESLKGSLGLPVIKPSGWVSPGLKRPNLRRIEQAQFLDAFSAGMPPLSNHGSRMDLRMDETASAQAKSAAPNATVMATNTAIPAGPVPGGADPIVKPIQPTITGDSAYSQMASRTPIDDLLASKPEPVSQGFDDPFVKEKSDSYDDPFGSRRPDSYDDPLGSRKSDSYDDPFGSRKSDSYDDPFGSRKSDSYDDPFGSSRYDSYGDSHMSRKSDSFDDPYISKQTDSSYDDPFPARLPEPVGYGSDDAYVSVNEPAKAGHHEFPFDPIKAQPDAHSGFPYAIPEDPRPPRSFKPILAALGVVAVIFLVAVLIPLQETLRLRSDLQYLENSASAHVSVEVIMMLQAEINETDRQITARRDEITRINERMGIIRNFYLLPPALIMVPEALENAGVHVDSVVASDNQVSIRGRTRAMLSLVHASQYLRGDSNYHSPFAHLFTVDFDSDNVGGGYEEYVFTITMGPNYMPFWLNEWIERSWQ